MKLHALRSELFTSRSKVARALGAGLRRMGLGDLAAADLNGDGWVDARDMQSYMQGGGGAAPRPQAADAPPVVGGGGW